MGGFRYVMTRRSFLKGLLGAALLLVPSRRVFGRVDEAAQRISLSDGPFERAVEIEQRQSLSDLDAVLKAHYEQPIIDSLNRELKLYSKIRSDVEDHRVYMARPRSFRVS